MKALSIKEYNEQQTAKWNNDYDKAMKEVRGGYRSSGCLPQLAFYIFNKSCGYVAFGDKVHVWAKTKKEAISRYEKHPTYTS